ncbi:MAG: phosphoglycerate kinase [Candidatus Woesearchaeota archaeon]|jgi:phosphoglycerate kinase
MPYKGIHTIDEIDFKGRKVFLRVDYNVPLDDKGKILDDFRIKESLPTIKKIFQAGATQIIIASHLGRPENKEAIFKMDEVAKKVYLMTGKKTEKVSDCIDLEGVFPSPQEASIVVLENLRFHEEEEKNDEKFAEKLAKHADIYINDAFGVSHRKHASVHAITKFIPGGIGLLVEKELKVFDTLFENPERPMIAILGGSKLETKLPLILNLVEKVDQLLIGGAMIFTFYKSKDYDIGKSLFDKAYITHAKMLLNNEKIILPTDVVIADDKDLPTNIITMEPKNIPSYMMGLDIGKNSIEDFKTRLLTAKTVIWNGPLGYYENLKFAKATNELLTFLANNPQIKTIIGGGDTASAAENLGLRDKFFHTSTGGGASLTLLEGKQLIALVALNENTVRFKLGGA